MRSIIKVLTCVLLALVVFVPIRTSWAHEYTPAEKKMIDDCTKQAIFNSSYGTSLLSFKSAIISHVALIYSSSKNLNFTHL